MSRMIRPGGSRASHRVTATASGCNSTHSVRAECAAATGGSTHGRTRFERIRAATRRGEQWENNQNGGHSFIPLRPTNGAYPATRIPG